MGKSKSIISSSNTSASKKKDNIELQLMQVLKTPSFTNEYHDIFDLVIHGDLRIKAVRHSLFSKWKDPHKGRIFFKFNKSIGANTNKLVALVSGLTNLAILEVYLAQKL